MEYEILPLEYKKTFSRFTNLLRFIGLEIFDTPNLKSKARLFCFNIFFLPFICSQFYLITEIRAENFLEGAQIVPVSVMFVIDVLKMSIAIVKRSSMKELFVETGELWPRGSLSDEKQYILNTWLKRMSRLLDAFFIYAVINLAMFEVVPLLITCGSLITGDEVSAFPFRLVGLWQVDSVMTYIVTYIWELCSTVPCQICLYLPFDMLIVVTTSNVSVLLRMLQIDLENAVSNDGRRNMALDDPDSVQKILRIVKDHQKLLRLAKQLNHVFGLVIFIHVAFSSVEICFFGFLTVVFGGVAETVANLLTVWNSVITIFLLALAGQLLSDTSANVAVAAYKSYWYLSDKRVKKLILFIIIRSQRASYLSALGFSDMTLRSFSKIMSSAWTYFSLLIQVYEGN